MTRRYLVICENGPLEFHLEGLAQNGQPLPSVTTRIAEVPEEGLAEWLSVTLPVAEPISA